MAVTTLIPFEIFPTCVYDCGALYDANGGCVPPGFREASPDIYTACFCADPRVKKFSSQSTGVCDNACIGTPEGLASVQTWFMSACGVTSESTTSTTTTSTLTGTEGFASDKPKKVYDSWIDGHWKWVAAIVSIFILIVGCWIGACIWRRAYLRKKDRMYELGKGIPTNSTTNFPVADASQVGVAQSSNVEKIRKWTGRA
ncbi:hypothetical protein Cpir12675_002172 [Ceratocystis pirilliformis]|uniref:Integral membrane protein n=1 Tax=Ceratocystis pirilliformis TaxID=259994 RepID=A0ABR3ZC42_9PEZI